MIVVLLVDCCIWCIGWFIVVYIIFCRIYCFITKYDIVLIWLVVMMRMYASLWWWMDIIIIVPRPTKNKATTLKLKGIVEWTINFVVIDFQWIWPSGCWAMVMPLHDTTGRAAAAMVSMILFVVLVIFMGRVAKDMTRWRMSTAWLCT